MKNHREKILQEIQYLIDTLKNINNDLNKSSSEELIKELQQTSRALLDKLAVYRYLIINFEEDEITEAPQQSSEIPENTDELLIPATKTLNDPKPSTEKENIVTDWLKSNISKEDLNEKLQKNALSDLKNVIGLNEKILFMKEFFNGNQEQYNKFISALNDTHSFEEAEKVFDAFSIPRQKDAFQVLNSLLEIRYS